MKTRLLRGLIGSVIILSTVIWQAEAQTSRPQGNADRNAVLTRTSRNFKLHTDLSAAEAQELLERLEKMLKIISRYWTRPNSKVIECYVVDRIERWPDGVIPPNVREQVRNGGGLTLSKVRSNGRQFDAQAVVYASASGGTPQHEAVHAYCAINFGRTGPVWYSEGMAEMGKYWIDGERTVNCRQSVADYLRGSPRRSIEQIVEEQARTGDSWQNYARRWSLCHVLANNPNYSTRFRPLGLSLLAGKRTSFNAVYGSMLPELNFEYQFFLDHLQPGFRIDLCAWDWKARFRKPKSTSSIVSVVRADRGWQPSRLETEEGTSVDFDVTGSWQLQDGGPETGAAGDERGRGRLVGTLWHEKELGRPFPVPLDRTWTAPGPGRLMLRCEDDWGKIGDNSGQVTVRIRLPED